MFYSSTIAGVIFTQLFWLGLETADYYGFFKLDSSFVQQRDALKGPMGTKTLVKVYRRSELMTPAQFGVIIVKANNERQHQHVRH